PASGRCIDVAVDHGFFGEAGLLAGIEDMTAAVEVLAAAGPDALQLAPGQAPLLQALPGRKPALVLRIDVTNAYEPAPPAEPLRVLLEHARRLRRGRSACAATTPSGSPCPSTRRACASTCSTPRAGASCAGSASRTSRRRA